MPDANPFYPYTYRLAPRQYVCDYCGFTCPTGPASDTGSYPGAETMLNHLRTEHQAQKVWDERGFTTAKGTTA